MNKEVEIRKALDRGKELREASRNLMFYAKLLLAEAQEYNKQAQNLLAELKEETE